MDRWIDTASIKDTQNSSPDPERLWVISRPEIYVDFALLATTVIAFYHHTLAIALRQTQMRHMFEADGVINTNKLPRSFRDDANLCTLLDLFSVLFFVCLFACFFFFSFLPRETRWSVHHVVTLVACQS